MAEKLYPPVHPDDGPGMVRMRGDDFLDPSRSHRRSPDWDGVERVRLVEEVLIPFRNGSSGMFRRFDWGRRALGEPEPVPTGEVLVVDLVGLSHPETAGAMDLSISTGTSHREKPPTCSTRPDDSRGSQGPLRADQ